MNRYKIVAWGIVASIGIFCSLAAGQPRPAVPPFGLEFAIGVPGGVADDITNFTNKKNNPYVDIYVRGGPLRFVVGAGTYRWAPGRVSGDWIRGIECAIVGPAGQTVSLGDWSRWTTPAVAESYQIPPDEPTFRGLVPLEIVRQLPIGPLEASCSAEWQGKAVTSAPSLIPGPDVHLVEPDTPIHRAIYYYQWAADVDLQATHLERPKANERAWQLMQGALKENVWIPCIWGWAAAWARDTGRNRRAAELFTRYLEELTAAVARGEPGYRPEDTIDIDPREKLKEVRADFSKQIAHLRSLPDEE
ncbi:MAG: hypothetical protein HYV63_16990 [Candidatus Schekmanbacteria bacterium]|nr:hypothetical protein [Candidatus Schekmanbacteria bacterium]